MRRLRRARLDRPRLRRSAPLSPLRPADPRRCTPARRPGCCGTAKAPSPRASATAAATSPPTRSTDRSTTAALVRDDGALAFAAMLQLRHGDTGLVLRRGDARAPRCRCCGTTARRRSCSPASRSSLLLWRSGTALRPAPRRRGAGAPLGRRAGAAHRRLRRRRRRRGAASGERARARGSRAPLDRRLRRPPRRARTRRGDRAHDPATTRRAGRGDEPAAAPDRHRLATAIARLETPVVPFFRIAADRRAALSIRTESAMSTTDPPPPSATPPRSCSACATRSARRRRPARRRRAVLIALVASRPRAHRRRARPGQDAAGARAGAIARRCASRASSSRPT